MGGGDRVQSTGHIKLSDKFLPWHCNRAIGWWDQGSGGATIGAGVADCHPRHKPGVALPPQKFEASPTLN